jgi:hypothetical protein
MMLSSVPVRPRRCISPLTCGYRRVRAGRCPGRSRRPGYLPGNRPARLPGQAPDGQAGTLPPGHFGITLLTSAGLARARGAGQVPPLTPIRTRGRRDILRDRAASRLSCAVSRVSVLAAIRVPDACRPDGCSQCHHAGPARHIRGPGWRVRRRLLPGTRTARCPRPAMPARHPHGGPRASHHPVRPAPGRQPRPCRAAGEPLRIFHGRSVPPAVSRHWPALVREVCPGS